jgi:kumamolisin
VALTGSARRSPSATEAASPFPTDETVEATLVLRRRAEPAADAFDRVWTRAELAERYGADPADVGVVTEAVTDAGAAVVGVDAAARLVRISAPASVMNELFGITLQQARVCTSGAQARARHQDRELSLPGHLANVVTSVLGLDTRPQARQKLRISPAAAPDQVSYTPTELATVYRMSTAVDGDGQSIALIELGGGYSSSDLQDYFAALGMDVPDIRSHGVDGAENAPTGNPHGPDGEVTLDIEVAGALAPAARLDVYFAPNTDDGFLHALTAASKAKPAPAAISISWGASEDTWAATSRSAMDQAIADASLLGATVTAAAGDTGSSDSAPSDSAPSDNALSGNTSRSCDGVSEPSADASDTTHVDFPASSPHALSCGGTTLRADPATGQVTSETVWNDGRSGGATGGGVSDVFELPDWQDGAGVPPRAGAGVPARGGATACPAPGQGRGVPDVAAVADPRTGYSVLVGGKRLVIGGTSAVAPLWAALIARLAQARRRPIGLAQPALYAGVSPGAAAPGFRDVTEGNNGAYDAGPGWDACTGLGTPLGDELASRLGTSSR